MRRVLFLRKGFRLRQGGSDKPFLGPPGAPGFDRTRRQLSQLFVWGFEGTTVSASLRRLFEKYPPGGVVLFKRNLESPRQVRALTTELQASSEIPLLIGVDQEGGRVSRLPEPFTPFPPAATLGEIYRQGRDKRLMARLGSYLARQLLSVGINTNFAPVLDVNSNPGNPVIGDRAFSDDPRVAAQAAVAFFLGMKKGGVIACGKHFPGHGDTETDSHLTLPRVTRKKRELEGIELIPFRRAIRQKIPMLMTAHVVYKALDPKRPATLSPLILQRLLRRRLGFGGVVITDDLKMKAISQKYSVAKASLLALKAGCDLLLVCTKGEMGGAVIEEMVSVIPKDPLLRRRLEESYSRVLRLKKRYLK